MPSKPCATALGPGIAPRKVTTTSAFEVLNPGHHSSSTGGPQHAQRTHMLRCDKNGSPFAFKALRCCAGPGHSASKGYDNSAFEVLNPGHQSCSTGGPQHAQRTRMVRCDKNWSPFAFEALRYCAGPGHSASKGYDNSAFEVLNPGHQSCSTGGPQHAQRTLMLRCDKNGSPFAFKALRYGHSASKGYDNSAFEVLNPGHQSCSTGPQHAQQTHMLRCDKNGSPFAFKALRYCAGPGHSASKGYDNSAFEVLNPGHQSCSTGGPQHAQRTHMLRCDKNGSPFAFKALRWARA